jgi:hypothetical protein
LNLKEKFLNSNVIDFDKIGKVKTIEVMKDIVEVGVIEGLKRIKELNINSLSDDIYKDVLTAHILITIEKYIKFND